MKLKIQKNVMQTQINLTPYFFFNEVKKNEAELSVPQSQFKSQKIIHFCTNSLKTDSEWFPI